MSRRPRLRPRLHRGRFVLAGALLGSALAVVASAPASPAGAAAEPTVTDRARGLVYEGLRRASSGSACRGAFEVTVDAGGPPVCTHGPDPAPAALDVRKRRAAEAGAGAEAQPEPSTANAVAPISCVGDGVGGNRVHAIYAVASDKTDRFATTVASIRAWAATAEDVFEATAAKTGGERQVRWVTDSNCGLVVSKAVLPTDGDDSLSRTITALKNQGYNRTDRKYLVWVDANVYCGIAGVYGDDRGSSSNYNNGGYAMYARVDNGCWGLASSPVEAHELTHNLGGVQPSAPNATSGFHCTDENDLMCYKDATGVVLSYVCPSTDEKLLDCRNDDYFHTSPPDGSYLATHWNVANSSFLHVPAAPPPPPPPPTTKTVTYTGTLTDTKRAVAYAHTTGAGELKGVLTFTRASTMRLQVKTGTVYVADVKGPSPVTAAVNVAAGVHKVVVRGPAGAEYSLSVTYVVP